MQAEMTLPTLDTSSSDRPLEMKSAKFPDSTPKRTSAIVQPVPRRLLPTQHPVPCFPPTTQTTDDTARNLKGEQYRGNTLPSSFTDENNSSQSSAPSKSPPNEGTSVLHPKHPPPLVSPFMDLSTRRSTAFSVCDLLGMKDSAKSEPKMPPHAAYPSPVYPAMMAPVAYPSAYLFPQRMDANTSTEYPNRAVLKGTSPTDKSQSRHPSPIGPSRSLTSSPESPKSDTSVSDRSDPNSSTDPETSPNMYKTALDKKSNRTNYTPTQVRRLEKVFLENPYPEHEMYEQLSKDLSIPEPRLKVWFQNKRARWKRRAEDKMTQPSAFPFPMMPMGYPYGMMPGSMTSPPESPSQPLPQSMYPYAATHPGLMMYPGSCYPHPLYPYLQHQMHVQQ